MKKTTAIEQFEEKSSIGREFISANPVELLEDTIEQAYRDSKLIFNRLAELYNNREKTLSVEECNYISNYGKIKSIPDLKEIDAFLRPDGFIENNKFKIIEMNAGTDIGGMLAMQYMQDYYSEVNPELEFGNMLDALVNWSNKLTQNSSKMYWYRCFGRNERYEKQNEKLVSLIGEQGAEIKFLDIRQVAEELKKHSEQSVVLVSRQDLIDDANDAAEIMQLEEYSFVNNIKLYNPNSIMLPLNSKVFLAFLLEYSSDESIVKCFWLGNRDTKEDKFLVRQKKVIETQKSYVLKRDFSYQGKHVYFGDEMDEANWKTIVLDAIKEGNWVAQELQLGEKYKFTDYLGKSNYYYGVVSPFVIGGKGAGMAIRYRLNEKNKKCVMPNNSETLLAIAGSK